MRYLPLIIIVFLCLLLFGDNSNYFFLDSYKNAGLFLKENRVLIKEKLGEENSLINEKIAIVFPEVCKYIKYKDVIETKALEIIYTSYGLDGADFSIGYFQMKPSFAEHIEEQISKYDFLKEEHMHLILYRKNGIKNIRKERILRLKELKWQLEYLNCFYDFISYRFKDVKWKNEEQKIRFFATAYNHGLLKSYDEIEKWCYIKIFPYGIYKGTNQYAYSDISIAYLNSNLVFF